jgi:hypothetical protein
MLTRKHFVELAKICANVADKDSRNRLVEQTATFCQEQNSNFNKKTFTDAVQMYSELHPDYRTT